jgi:hypothetical protein
MGRHSLEVRSARAANVVVAAPGSTRLSTLERADDRDS